MSDMLGCGKSGCTWDDVCGGMPYGCSGWVPLLCAVLVDEEPV